MTRESDNEIFTIQFRHEQVTRFLKGFFDGSITLYWSPETFDSELKSILIKDRIELVELIEQYVAENLTIDQRNDIEQRIFRKLAIMKMTGLIQEMRPTQTQIEKEIISLHQRMDSNNVLLRQIIEILKKVGEKLGD